MHRTQTSSSLTRINTSLKPADLRFQASNSGSSRISLRLLCSAHGSQCTRPLQPTPPSCDSTHLLGSPPSMQHTAACALQHRPLQKLPTSATRLNALLQHLSAAIASTQRIQKHHGQRTARLAPPISRVCCTLVVAAPARKKTIKLPEVQARPAVAAVANSKQPVCRQRLQPSTQHIVSQRPGNLKIAGTQRLIKAVLLVAVLIHNLRAVTTEVEKQVLLFGNASIHGVLRHLQSAHDVSERSPQHPCAINLYSLVTAHHVAAEHHSTLPEKGCKRHNVVSTSLQLKPTRRQVPIPKSDLHRKKLSAAPKMTTHNSGNQVGRHLDIFCCMSFRNAVHQLRSNLLFRQRRTGLKPRNLGQQPLTLLLVPRFDIQKIPLAGQPHHLN